MLFSTRSHHVPRAVATITALSAALVLVACGDSKDGKKAASQTVAKVNKEELTVHQVNFLLGQQRGLKPEQADAASRQILERLIDQELAIQKATEQKLDRDPRVVSQLEAARREIISRAYFDRVGEGAPKPTAEEVKKYYDDNPALFAARRIYQLQEIAIEIEKEKVDTLREPLKAAKSVAEFLQYLQAQNIKHTSSQAVRAAEQLPMNMLSTAAKMKDGDTLFTAHAKGVTVVALVGSKAQPVDEARARPAIEAYLLNERKRQIISQDLKSLRSAAEIRYQGKYADGAPASAGAASAPTAADVAASAVSPQGEAPAQKDAAAQPASAASTLDSGTISKGLGLK